MSTSSAQALSNECAATGQQCSRVVTWNTSASEVRTTGRQGNTENRQRHPVTDCSRRTHPAGRVSLSEVWFAIGAQLLSEVRRTFSVPPDGRSMSGKLLLLVDDDEAVADGLALILSIEGFRVQTLTRSRRVLGLVRTLRGYSA